MYKTWSLKRTKSIINQSIRFAYCDTELHCWNNLLGYSCHWYL